MDRYIQEATGQAEELVEALSEHEIQTLRERFSESSEHAWLQWQADCVAEIQSFVRSTPAARRKSSQWKCLFPFLAYAAYLQCRQAYAMLRTVSRFDLTPGGSYRDMTARAAQAFRAAIYAEHDLPDWPWDGEPPRFPDEN